MNYRISRGDLTKLMIDEGRGTTYCFEGGDHGLAHLSFIVGEYQPGCIARKHRHAYDEIFIVNEGCGTYTIGDTMIHVSLETWLSYLPELGTGSRTMPSRSCVTQQSTALAHWRWNFRPTEREENWKLLRDGRGGVAAIYRGVVERKP